MLTIIHSCVRHSKLRPMPLCGCCHLANLMAQFQYNCGPILKVSQRLQCSKRVPKFSDSLDALVPQYQRIPNISSLISQLIIQEQHRLHSSRDIGYMWATNRQVQK